MKKICFVTAARSEYGLLKWLMKDVNDSNDFELQVIVTGGHLSFEQGHTIDQIVEDGFDISYIVDSELDTSTTGKIAESMGKMSQGFAKAFEILKPDYLLVLGDRYELLPICSTALVMRVPIIHLCGGDVTEGAIDDSVRNAVTMLADFHFAGTEEAAQNIRRMRNTDERIWVVGEPGLDAFNRNELLTRQELADDLGLDIHRKWVLLTYHSETKETLAYNLQAVRSICDALLVDKQIQVVATYANADFGGQQINNMLMEISNNNDEQLKVISSLGQRRYLSFMKQVEFVIGNSSSGIVEAPFLNIPVINVGDRQKGRYLCSNIMQSNPEESEIKFCIEKVLEYKTTNHSDSFYWGDGHTSQAIMGILCDQLK